MFATASSRLTYSSRMYLLTTYERSSAFNFVSFVLMVLSNMLRRALRPNPFSCFLKRVASLHATCSSLLTFLSLRMSNSTSSILRSRFVLPSIRGSVRLSQFDRKYWDNLPSRDSGEYFFTKLNWSNMIFLRDWIVTTCSSSNLAFRFLIKWVN